MQKLSRFFISLTFTLSTLTGGLFLPMAVFAQNQAIGLNCSNINQGSGLNVGCNANLSGIVATVVKILFIAAVLLALLFLIIGGVRWILSGGDKEGTTKARGMITAAIIGLAIVFLAFVIINVLGIIFGFSISNLSIPSFSQVTQ